MPRKACALAALAWFSAASVAWAGSQPVAASLDLHRASSAETCLDARALANGVEARLRRSVFVPRERAELRVEVRLGRRLEGAWLAQIELRSAEGKLVGTRELVTSAEHCSALDESLSLAIALMVDISADELPEPAKKPASGPSRAAPPRAPIELPRDTHAPREPWRFSAVALGTLAVGVLPGVAPGVRLGFGAEPPAFWPIELFASWWPAQRASSEDAGARFTALTVGLYVCPVSVGTENTRAEFCLGQEVGQLGVRGFGFDRNDERTRLTYDLSLRVRTSQHLVGPLKLVAGVQALWPLSRDRFVADEADGGRREVFRRPFMAGAAELGVGLDFH